MSDILPKDGTKVTIIKVITQLIHRTSILLALIDSPEFAHLTYFSSYSLGGADRQPTRSILGGKFENGKMKRTFSRAKVKNIIKAHNKKLRMQGKVDILVRIAR